MPLPSPRKGESQKDFMTRCVANPKMRSEYKDDQVVAICYTQWRQRE